MSDMARVGIVFTDVDGTFVGEDHHPILETAGVVQELARRMPLCLVSARGPEGLYPIQEALGFWGPLACYSGALVLGEHGEELLSQTISCALAIELKTRLSREFPHMSVGTYGFHDWVVDDRADPRIVREEGLVQTHAHESGDLSAWFAGRGVHKLLLMGEPDEVLVAQQMITRHYPGLVAVRSSDVLCEVMVAGASKSRAVELLCARYGVSPCQAVAFGDGPNDIDMLRAVGHSYAMANAEYEVKRAASHVLPWTNAEGGVAHMLERLLREE